MSPRRGPLNRWDIPRLAAALGLSVEDLEAIAADARREYEPREVEGRNGKKRLLSVPSARLKAVQRAILRGPLRVIAPHESSACTRGRGTLWAYQRHVGHSVMLSMDIADFFPSVKEMQVIEGFRRLGAGEKLAALLTTLTTVTGGLPQGAPTSVAVGDIVLFPLDIRFSGLCRGHGLVYTRYVDDLTISGGRRVEKHMATLRRIATELGWTLNEEKTVLAPPHQRHAMLGAVVNTRPNVTSEYFNEVRSYLRLVAKGRVMPAGAALRKLEARVQWICSVNPERAPALKPLLTEALEARADAA